MGFWLAAGAISLLVAFLILLAFLRPRAGASPAAAYDLQVYRDQLKEVDRDVERGILTEAEAARARTEVSRRILEADRALQKAGPPDKTRGGFDRWIIAGGLVAVRRGRRRRLFPDRRARLSRPAAGHPHRHHRRGARHAPRTGRGRGTGEHARRRARAARARGAGGAAQDDHGTAPRRRGGHGAAGVERGGAGQLPRRADRAGASDRPFWATKPRARTIHRPGRDDDPGCRRLCQPRGRGSAGAGPGASSRGTAPRATTPGSCMPSRAARTSPFRSGATCWPKARPTRHGSTRSASRSRRSRRWRANASASPTCRSRIGAGLRPVTRRHGGRRRDGARGSRRDDRRAWSRVWPDGWPPKAVRRRTGRG
jgi:cytochrome c-type biogenesis protein CcmI